MKTEKSLSDKIVEGKYKDEIGMVYIDDIKDAVRRLKERVHSKLTKLGVRISEEDTSDLIGVNNAIYSVKTEIDEIFGKDLVENHSPQDAPISNEGSKGVTPKHTTSSDTQNQKNPDSDTINNLEEWGKNLIEISKVEEIIGEILKRQEYSHKLNHFVNLLKQKLKQSRREE